MLLYLAENDPDYYTVAAENFLQDNSQQEFMNFANYLRIQTDNRKGPYLNPMPGIGLTGYDVANGMNQYFRENGIDHTARWGTNVDILPDVKTMLDKNIPVILGIGKDFNGNGVEDTVTLKGSGVVNEKIGDKGGHFVTITGLDFDVDGNATLTVSSWGNEYTVDYNEYLQHVKEQPLGNILSNVLVIE